MHSDPTPGGATGTPVELIVVPYDSGRRAWRMGAGPVNLLDRGIADAIAGWGHPVRITWMETHETEPLASAAELALSIAARVRDSCSSGVIPIVLSGNCMSTVAAVAGCATPGTGVVWLDAHGDLNTPETSPSGFLDGMAGAALLGWCHSEALSGTSEPEPRRASQLLVVGSRALDDGETRAAAAHGVRILVPAEARREADLQAALEVFGGDVRDVYLHVDLDVLDPDDVGPANSFASPGGLLLAEALRVIEAVSARWAVRGLTLSAYEPDADPEGRMFGAALPLIAAALQPRR
jgi:arginase